MTTSKYAKLTTEFFKVLSTIRNRSQRAWLVIVLFTSLLYCSTFGSVNNTDLLAKQGKIDGYNTHQVDGLTDMFGYNNYRYTKTDVSSTRYVGASFRV